MRYLLRFLGLGLNGRSSAWASMSVTEEDEEGVSEKGRWVVVVVEQCFQELRRVGVGLVLEARAVVGEDILCWAFGREYDEDDISLRKISKVLFMYVAGWMSV
jgi:hypothetical protein